MPFPTTPIFEDFSSDLSRWTNPAYGNSALVISQGAVMGTNNANQNAAQWKTLVADADCEMYATVRTIGLSGEGLRLRIRETNATGSPTAYVLVWNTAGGAWSIDRVELGSVTATVASGSQVLSNGDAVGIQAIGTTVYAWRKPAAGAWGLVGFGSDAVITAPGYLGLRIQNATMAADDVGGGISTLTAGAKVTLVSTR